MRGLRSSKYGLLLSTIICSCFFNFNFAQAAIDHLVISQVQVGGDNSTNPSNDEFIELFNPTNQCVSLNNWSLQYLSSTGNFGTIKVSNLPNVLMPPQTYFLSASSYYNNSSVAADSTSTNFSMSGASTGATIFLTNSTQKVASGTDPIIVDKMSYGTSASNSPEGQAVQFPADPVPAPEWSFFRIGETDNNFTDFVTQVSAPRHASSATCGISNEDSDPTPEDSAGVDDRVLEISPDIKISEILPNPAGEDDGNEAVELVNVGTTTVSVDGWFLDDKSDSGIKPSALEIASTTAATTTIAPGEFLVIIIPKGQFALNNSGGETVNLYFYDKSLADTISYTESAQENYGWQNVNSQWMWAPQTLGFQNAAPPVSTGGGTSGGTVQSVQSNSNLTATIQISEFLPNPLGDDSGRQWAEIYNYGSLAANLKDWILDDDASSTIPGSNALVLGSISIAPKSYLSVIIPKGKFSLSNSGSDAVRLFKPDKTLLEKISYTNAPEGSSLALDLATNKWSFTVPTPGKENQFNVPLLPIRINELLPNPGEDDDEFVEFFNATSATSSLENFRLKIGSYEKTLEKISLSPQSYLTIYEEDLPAKLRNNGQIVLLFDSYGREVGKVEYSKATRSQAYAFSEGNYFWTEKPTPGSDNEVVLAASSENSLADLPKADSSTKQKTISYNQLYQETKKTNEELTQKLDNLQNLVAILLEKPAENELVKSEEVRSNPETSQNQAKLYLSIAILAALVLILLIKQFFWKKSA